MSQYFAKYSESFPVCYRDLKEFSNLLSRNWNVTSRGKKNEGEIPLNIFGIYASSMVRRTKADFTNIS